MATWIIGDLQGCHASLQALLAEVGYLQGRDHLIFVGDLINRGPGSLDCLREVRELCNAGSAMSVLGNHDLHLLAVAAGIRKQNPDDTLDDILAAPDRAALLDWLASQPLLLRAGDDVIVHAGVHPDWDIPTAEACAREVEAELTGPDRQAFLARMYGNQPARWDACTDTAARQRFAVNVFTRMRFVSRDDHVLMLKAKGSAESPPDGACAWFTVPGRRDPGTHIYFGHWSTLGTIRWPEHGVDCLDTGCVWNGRLTAIEPATGQIVSVPAAPGDGRPPL